MGGKRITWTNDKINNSIQCTIRAGAYDVSSVNISTNGEQALVRFHNSKTSHKGANTSSPVSIGGDVCDLVKMFEGIVERVRKEK